MSAPDLHRPAAEDLLSELRQITFLLERLVGLEEERRDGERRMEALGAMLAGGDSEMGDDLTDQELLDAHFRKVDGSYGINLPDSSQRPATPEEERRLRQLVGRQRRKP